MILYRYIPCYDRWGWITQEKDVMCAASFLVQVAPVSVKIAARVQVRHAALSLQEALLSLASVEPSGMSENTDTYKSIKI